VSDKNPKNYIDNDVFLKDIIEYKEKLKEYREKGITERPPMKDSLGLAFYKIAENYSHKHSFIRYPFREEMVMDAVYFCVKYIDNFNPEKTKNPFAYFTTACFNAFLQRIEKEKTYLYNKYKLIENSEIFNEISDNQESDSSNYNNDNETIPYSEGAKEYRNEFVKKYEEAQERKKQKLLKSKQSKKDESQ